MKNYQVKAEFPFDETYIEDAPETIFENFEFVSDAKERAWELHRDYSMVHIYNPATNEYYVYY